MKSRFSWWHVCLLFEDKYFRKVPSSAQSVARWVHMVFFLLRIHRFFTEFAINSGEHTIAHSSLHEARLKSPFGEATRLSLWAQHHLPSASFEHLRSSVKSYLIPASGCCLTSFPKEETRVQVLLKACPPDSLVSRVFWCGGAGFLGHSSHF